MPRLTLMPALNLTPLQAMKCSMVLFALAAVAACALPASAARDLHGMTAGVVAAPTGNATAEEVQPKFLDDILDYVESGIEQVADAIAGLWGGEVCIYGSNCGMNCEHDSYDESDPLDEACYEHDRCLADAASDEDKCACDDTLISAADEVRWPRAGGACKRAGPCMRRAHVLCVRRMVLAGAGPPPATPHAHALTHRCPTRRPQIAGWDDDSEMVRTAPTIRDGIAAFGKAMHGCYW